MIYRSAFHLRTWKASDKAHFAAISADPLVMEFFPSALSTHESDALADRIESHFRNFGWGLWALETADSLPYKARLFELCHSGKPPLLYLQVDLCRCEGRTSLVVTYVGNQ